MSLKHLMDKKQKLKEVTYITSTQHLDICICIDNISEEQLVDTEQKYNKVGEEMFKIV